MYSTVRNEFLASSTVFLFLWFSFASGLVLYNPHGHANYRFSFSMCTVEERIDPRFTEFQPKAQWDCNLNFKSF